MSGIESRDFEVNKIDHFLNQWNRCNELINSNDVNQCTYDAVAAITTELSELLVLEHPVHGQFSRSGIGDAFLIISRCLFLPVR